ncbi:AMP-dependent synthetase/ligase [Aphelenchoides avenae]|nr:AMP-dependent synthetase/ligase [Aphelenchus avenae]
MSIGTGESSFTDYFLLVTKRFDDKIALHDILADKKFTYADLAKACDEYSSILRRTGIRPGEIIGTYVGNSTSFIVFCLAAWKVGAVVCPINPGYKEAEICKYFGDAGVQWILCENLSLCPLVKKDETLRRIVKGLIVMEANEDGSLADLEVLQRNASSQSLPRSDVPSDTATIFFSSGTTGPPKGVLWSHRQLSAHLDIIISLKCSKVMPVLSPPDVVYGVLPFFHAGGLVTAYCMLAQGATLLVDRRFNKDSFFETLSKHRVTVLNVVPPALELIAHSPETGKWDLSSLKYVFVGAAKVSSLTQSLVRERLPTLLDVVQLYGSTEAGVLLCMTPIKAYLKSKMDTCGIFLPGAEAKLIDVGENGGMKELCVKARTMMSSYLNDEDGQMKSSIFTEDGWLRTGDLATIDNDGFVSIVGRLKEVLKVRGWQVSPYELEDALKKRFPQIDEVAVFGVPNRESGELPAAAIVQKRDQTLTEEHIKAFVASNFISYKQLKGGVFFVENLPKTETGKVNRLKILGTLRDQHEL